MALTPTRWRAVKAVLDAALERSPAERPALVASRCGADAVLRAEVESLLAAAERGKDEDLAVPHTARAEALQRGGGATADRARDAGAAEADGAASGAARLAAALAGHYAVERVLGRGGMATVYLARDCRHKRSVALKVLAPHLGAVLGPDRFRREIETAANLSHPHILPLFDSGEAGGLLYYVMPYVAGESLRDRLRGATGPIPVGEVMRVVREVADALDYAHRHGVVHRDVKPENVLLDEDGHALVADFGIARAVQQASDGAPLGTTASRDAEALTGTGVVIGTPAYMSPEQALGERGVDGRSDVYSLACVAFELLSGETPFRGSAAEQVARRFAGPPPSLMGRPPGLSKAADGAFRTALALAPADRFPTATAFAAALGEALGAAASPAGSDPAAAEAAVRGTPRHVRSRPGGLVAVITGATTALLVAVGVYWFVALPTRANDANAGAGPPPAAPAAQPGAGVVPQSVVVLPLVNVAGDTASEYFADGMTEELTSALGRVPGLRVAARSSAFAFKGRAADTREVGRKLRVASVLEGTVRRVGSRLRVTVQLVNAADGLTLWSDSYQREVKDVFAVQEEIATAIAGALRPALGTAPGARVAIRAPAHLEAYELYLKGRFHFAKGQTEQDFRTSIRLFEQVLALDSTYVPAWAGLAEAWVWLADIYVAPRDAYPQARAAASRAVALDPTSADARAALGLVLLSYDWDLRGAEHELRQAIRLNPNAAHAHHYYGYVLFADPARLDAALATMRRAQALDPLSAWTTADVSWVLRLQGRHAEAVAEARAAVALDPRSAVGFLHLGLGLLDAGNASEALAAFRRAEDLGQQSAPAEIARALAATGRRAEARQVLGELVRDVRAGRRFVGGEKIAYAHAALGDRDAAFAWLETAYGERSANMITLRTETMYRPLRADPRFAALVRRVGPPP